MDVYSELLAARAPCGLAVWSNSIQRWRPPHDGEEIDRTKRKTILISLASAREITSCTFIARSGGLRVREHVPHGLLPLSPAEWDTSLANQPDISCANDIIPGVPLTSRRLAFKVHSTKVGGDRGELNPRHHQRPSAAGVADGQTVSLTLATQRTSQFFLRVTEMPTNRPRKQALATKPEKRKTKPTAKPYR
jgi:hypothetical protein